jgi:hypothetical protein
MEENNLYGVKFIGPFQPEYKITVDGYRVPYLTALSSGDNVLLCLDERYILEVNKEEASKWLPFLANAMAVAAGYSCHGENCNICTEK